jgi:hypothetical protein
MNSGYQQIFRPGSDGTDERYTDHEGPDRHMKSSGLADGKVGLARTAVAL